MTVNLKTATFTVCQLRLNAKGEYEVANKQHLNDFFEVEEWAYEVYGKFASIRIVCDQNGKVMEYTDNGEKWERCDDRKG